MPATLSAIQCGRQVVAVVWSFTFVFAALRATEWLARNVARTSQPSVSQSLADVLTPGDKTRLTGGSVRGRSKLNHV